VRRLSDIVYSGIGIMLICSPTVAQAPAESPPLSPLLIESLAPLFASWIVSERDAAIRQGVEPIPASIRTALTGYVPEPILDRVRWRQGATELSLPQSIFRFGEIQAMVLEDVVIFNDRREALEDPKLWAHELKHVMQFAEWGVDGFAVRYLRDYDAIETEAAEFRWQFMKSAGLLPPVPSPAE
jgi:hypothetical protein